jgi:hypothetical protein
VTSTTFTNFAADSDCNAFAANGNIKAPSTKIPAFVIPAGSPVGRYNINAHFNAQASSSAGFSCVYRISSSSFDSKTYEVTSSVANGTGVGTQSFSVYVDNTDTDLTFQINASSGGGACRLIQTIPRIKYGFDVYYFPDSTNTIVTQNTELTAQSANEFVAFVSGTGVVSGENFDWINGDCSISGTSNFTCNLKSGLFESPPVCSVTFDRVADNNSTYTERLAWINTVTKDKVYYATSFNLAMTAVAVQLNCTRSTDYRKHATIVGKFENINSSELVKVEASGNGGQAITADVTNITWSNETMDNYNAWNGTTFTAPKDSWYILSGAVQYTTTAAQAPALYVNSAFSHRCGQLNSGFTTTSSFTCLVKLSKNDISSIRNQAGTLANSVNHRLYITELPDTESIIKNLNEDREIYVFANGTSGHAIGTSATDHPFTTEVEDTHSAYNPTTGVFTAPRNATCSVSYNASTAAVTLGVSERFFSEILTSDGRNVFGQRSNGNGSSNNHSSFGVATLKMQSGQTIKVRSRSSVATTATTTTIDNYLTIRCK